jgi:signal peptidase I
MTPLAILILFLLVSIIYILPALGVALLFKKAGEARWKAFIPLYNSIVMLKISERPFYWAFMQFIPVFGFLFTIAIFIEFLRTFGKTRFDQYILVPLTAGLYFLYLGLRKKTRFNGPQEMKGFSASAALNGLGVAVVTIAAIATVCSFVYQSYYLPTTTMEKTLLVGDLALVNRFDHHIDRGDVMVFHFPEGDTVISVAGFQSARPYYDIIRQLGRGDADAGRQIVLNNPDQYPLTIKPIDMEVNYIKRVVAMPGDTLLIRDELLYIDGKPEPAPSGSETYYRLKTNGQPLDEDQMKEAYDLDIADPDQFRPAGTPNQYEALLTSQACDNLLKNGLAASITPDIDSTIGEVFPYDSLHSWTRDNYGPVWIPRKGATIALTPENYNLYARIIRTYEGNAFERNAGKFMLNGRKATTYTFKMDYYWVMGDARHGSQDSRYWGFVPEDHVVGKTSLILASWNKGVKWNRTFKKVE